MAARAVCKARRPSVAGSQAVFEARQRHRERTDLLLLSTTYWLLGEQPVDMGPDFIQRSMGHACEWETSMILKIAPRLVADLSAIEAVPMGDPFAPASRGWITRDRSPKGHIGDPRRASAEKGELLFRRFSQDVTEFLNRVIGWDGRTWGA